MPKVLDEKMKKGNDLSGWNPVENYHKLAAAGCEFTILKAIKATLQPDKLFETHYKGCGEAGIPVIGVYTYSYANTVEKARTAIKACIDVTNRICAEYPLYTKPKRFYLDLEDVKMRGLGKNIVDIINTYKMYAEEAGYELCIYTYQNYYTNYIKPYLPYLQEIKFWMAKYPSTEVTTFKDKLPCCNMNIPNMLGWQYSSKGKVPGITGYADMNVWFEDETTVNKPVKQITAESNPFKEPDGYITLGNNGEGSKWVQWYLWRFGLLLTNGVPDSKKITGYIDNESFEAIKTAQVRLGLTGRQVDGIVGKATKALFRKVL